MRGNKLANIRENEVNANIFEHTEIQLHVPIFTDCGTLVAPEDGSVAFTTTTFESVATYTCNPGYFITGGTVRVCLHDGYWTGTDPSCHRKGLKKIKLLNYMYMYIN